MTGGRTLLACAFALAGLACAPVRPPDSKTGYEICGALDGHEPTVRVYLRSLGEAWTRRRIEAKQGLQVRGPGFAFVTPAAVELRPAPGAKGTTTVAAGGSIGVRRAVSMTFMAKGGVLLVDGHAYAGILHCSQGRLILDVTLENYVLGVLRGELPLPRVPRAAAGALAIAVRSYTLHYLVQNRPDFDLDDTTRYQRFVGLRYAPDDADLRAGVQRTIGLYLGYGGRPLKAYYHSTCGGATTDAPTGLSRPGAPPLRSVTCNYCKASRYYRWTVRLTDREILEAAGLEAPLRGFAVAASGPGKRATKLRIEAGRVPAATIRAGAFRLALGPSRLRSTRILALERVAGGYEIRGAGWGHGVGLCQMGAVGQALLGRSAGEIVAYYYPGATVRRAY